MSFSVDVAALRGLPTLLERAADDATACSDYLHAHSGIAWRSQAGAVPVGTLLASIKPFHDQIIKVIDQHLTGPVREGASGCARQVDSAIAYYKGTDGRAAARADDAWPGALDPTFLAGLAGPNGHGSVSFTDVVEPVEQLKPPGRDAATSPYVIDATTGLFSVGAALRDLMWRLTDAATGLGLCSRPIDIFEEVVRPVVGDWPGLYAVSEAFHNIGLACSGIGENIGATESSVAGVWTGHASDACREYISRFSLALSATDYRLDQLAHIYSGLATDVMQICKQLGDLLMHLTDEVVYALLEVEAALATAETVIGGITFSGALVFDLFQIYKCFRMAESLVTAADTAVAGFTVALDTSDAMLTVDALPQLPQPPALPA